MTQYFSREKPHIVQSYLYWANIYGSLAAKIARVPVIMTGRRDTMEECRRFSRRWLQNFSNLWVTAVVTNSQNVKDHCLHRERFLHSSKIQVIYNGIEVNRYRVDSHLTEKKTVLQVPADAPVVGIIARLHPRKGHRDFLRAAACVLYTCPQPVFLIVGQDQGIQSELQTLAYELGISRSVIFTGDREDIPEILALLDVLVCASYIEGLSNAILEGMAAGKPVIATNVAGNPELVVHEQTGLLVPPGNPECLAAGILRLLENPGLRERFGEAGRERAAALFQMDQMIQRTEELYRSLVD
jgi:glycosyltransferase involved in cell wall biosynthesis